jgi:DNA-directed RNA polymerase specialized sigma24 family protein
MVRHIDPCKDLASLFERAKAADKAAEKQLFLCIGERFEAFHGHKIRRKEDLLDLKQEVCKEVSRKYKSEVFTKGFEFWLAGVMQNVLKRYFERLKRERKLKQAIQENPGNVPGPTPLSVNPELKRRLLGCIWRLKHANRRYAQAVCLSRRGFKGKEIALRLDTSPNNAYSVLYKGRNWLEKCMRDGKGTTGE